MVKTIDTFDFHAQPSINEMLVRELLRGECIQKKENVLLIGNPGTGKTHLATAGHSHWCVRFSIRKGPSIVTGVRRGPFAKSEDGE